MTEEELVSFLVGKKVKEVGTDFYMGRAVLEAIVFDDGSGIELAGQADVAYVWEATCSDGARIPMGRNR